ncbi:MAG: alkaline phosphatase family protein [Chloroflexi bacterium]|nr:alkaline phosphatase family protein [Chloroflexota bacterium]
MTTPKLNQRRVLVLGLDGATWDLLTPWINEGKLPHLARLQQTGSHGPLMSTIHPVTTPAWISFLTGRNQGQHGVYDHVQRRPDSYNMELMDATRIQSPLMFDYLGRQGYRSISINVPQTFPPPVIPGLMISGLFGTLVGPDITQPPSLYQKIQTVAPNYVVHPDYHPRHADALGQYARDLVQSEIDRIAVTETLLAEEDWQYAIVVMTGPDQSHHAFWGLMMDESPAAAPYRDAIFNVYKAIDDELPRLLRFADENTLLLVISDHGGGPLHALVNLNRWLADTGLLAFKGRKKGSWRNRLINFAAASYKKYVPTRLRTWVRRQYQGQFTQAKERMESQLFASAIDWSKTQAYSLGACGNIFVNLRGREPQGIVAPGAEYEAVCEQIIRDLVQLRSPEGQLIVKQVLRREAVYHGPHMEKAPDLIVIWHDYGYWGRARYDQNWPPLFEPVVNWDFSAIPLTGTHRPEGILIASGPGVQAGPISGANLIDITPTILAFLNTPVPQGFDGRALTELFTPGTLTVTYQDDDDHLQTGGGHRFSSEEEAQVLQHLERLGYI